MTITTETSSALAHRGDLVAEREDLYRQRAAGKDSSNPVERAEQRLRDLELTPRIYKLDAAIELAEQAVEAATVADRERLLAESRAAMRPVLEAFLLKLQALVPLNREVARLELREHERFHTFVDPKYIMSLEATITRVEEALGLREPERPHWGTE